MKWSTFQRDGQIRTIDTNDATILDLAIEFALWPVNAEARKKRKERKARRKAEAMANRTPVKFNWWVVVVMVAFVIFLAILGALT